MSDRRLLFSELEEARRSRVLVYFTGDRRGLETRIHPEVLDFFVHHLDAIGDVRKISLYLYTRGGDTLGAWSILNLVRQFCDELEVIVPSKAHSAGTLMCLGADTILMTKQATLGPIDPSVETPLNPAVPGAPNPGKVPVSVEDVNGFVDFARSVTTDEHNLSQALSSLAAAVHPLVLGKAFRARAQIRMLARKLMGSRYVDEQRIERILAFLCSESGSHDYTINRREAQNELGLAVEKPDDAQYKLIKALYDDIAAELELAAPYDPPSVLGSEQSRDYCLVRAVIQSLNGGKHSFVSEGRLARQEVPSPQGPKMGIHDQRSFEGWRFSNA